MSTETIGLSNITLEALDAAAANGQSPRTLMSLAAENGLSISDARKSIELGLLRRRQSSAFSLLARGLGLALIGGGAAFLMELPGLLVPAALGAILVVISMLWLVIGTIFPERVRQVSEDAAIATAVTAPAYDAASRLERLLREAATKQEARLGWVCLIGSLPIFTIPLTLFMYVVIRSSTDRAVSKAMAAFRGEGSVPVWAHVEVRRGYGIENATLCMRTITSEGKKQKLLCPVSPGDIESVFACLLEMYPELLIGDTSNNKRLYVVRAKEIRSKRR